MDNMDYMDNKRDIFGFIFSMIVVIGGVTLITVLTQKKSEGTRCETGYTYNKNHNTCYYGNYSDEIPSDKLSYNLNDKKTCPPNDYVIENDICVVKKCEDGYIKVNDTLCINNSLNIPQAEIYTI
jgi:hypothetical protein